MVQLLMEYKSWIHAGSLLEVHRDCLLFWNLSCHTYNIHQPTIHITQQSLPKSLTAAPETLLPTLQEIHIFRTREINIACMQHHCILMDNTLASKSMFFCKVQFLDF